MKTITVKGHEVPIIAEPDVFIAGGGPAGVGAAIQARRSGASVFLAEKLYALGGTLTSGLMSKIAVAQMTNGLPLEIIRRFDAYQGTHYENSRPEVPVDPETAKIILDESFRHGTENARSGRNTILTVQATGRWRIWPARTAWWKEERAIPPLPH